MELTKKQAIEEHRKMWNWIAEQIKIQPLKKLFSLLNYNWIVLISDLKCCYLYDVKKQVFDGLDNNCFCCEYARNESDYVYYDTDICRHCPIVWSGSDKTCCGVFGEYRELILLNGYSDENRRKAYKLALKIANLPEREGV